MAKPKQRVKQVSLPNKAAGMAASAVMSFAILVSIANRQDPFQTLTLAVIAGSMSGVIGYWLGLVMDTPKMTASPKKVTTAMKKQRNSKSKGATPELMDDYTPLGNVTGEETFLDDLASPSSHPES